jgi:hypothetical protein
LPASKPALSRTTRKDGPAPESAHMSEEILGD